MSLYKKESGYISSVLHFCHFDLSENFQKSKMIHELSLKLEMILPFGKPMSNPYQLRYFSFKFDEALTP